MGTIQAEQAWGAECLRPVSDGAELRLEPREAGGPSEQGGPMALPSWATGAVFSPSLELGAGGSKQPPPGAPPHSAPPHPVEPPFHSKA